MDGSEMTYKNDSTDVYLDAQGRMEPDVVGMDPQATLVSIAISLKRLADAIKQELDRRLTEAGKSAGQ
jgi:hypothetical protein